MDWYPASAKFQRSLHDQSPLASRASVGLVDFAGSKAGVVAQEFQAALLPPVDEVIAKVREHLANYIPAGDLKGVIDMLTERGWQPAQAVYAERAKQSKSVSGIRSQAAPTACVSRQIGNRRAGKPITIV